MDNKNKAINNKQIGINMAANVVSYSSNLIISFILTPFLINTLGKETYSFYPMANTIIGYMSVLSNALNSMASRFVTVSLVQGKDEDANYYYSSVLMSNIIMDLVLLLPLIIVIVFLDAFMDVPVNSLAAVRVLFAFVFSSALLNILASVFGIATFAKNRIDLRSLRELITSVIRLGLFFIMYTILPPSIVYVGVVTLIVAIVNIIFQINYTKVLLPEIKISKKYFSWPHTKELLSSSVWNAINTFGNNLLAGMSMILANLLFGAESSGTYSIVQTVPTFVNGIIVMLIGVFYPVITYKYAENDKIGLINEIKRTQNIVGLFSCAVTAVFVSLSSEFFSLWTPGENSIYLAQISAVVIMPHFFIATMWSLTNLNVVMNKVKVPAFFTLGMGVANVVLAVLLNNIFDWGLVSLSAISSVLQVIWVGIFIPQYTCYNLNVKWYTFYMPTFKAFISGIIMIALIMVCKQIFVIDSWLKLFGFGIIAGSFALVIFGTVMLGWKNSIRLFKTVSKKMLKR